MKTGGSRLLALLVAGMTLQNPAFPAQVEQQTPSVEQSLPSDQSRTPAKKQRIKHLKSEGTPTDWYSEDTDIKLGRERSQQIERSMSMIQDPAVNEYVNLIGQKLVLNSDAMFTFTIKVVDSDEINVFALPGGFLYVTSGLIKASDNEAELAGVMAHGVAHVAARHAIRMMTRMAIANIMNVSLIPAGSNYVCPDCPTALSLPLVFVKFSRDFEAEADYLGLQYTYNAGYDPNGFIVFLEKLGKRENLKAGTLAASFATHPPAIERIRAARKEIVKILPERDHSVMNTPDFDQVKARLVAIGNGAP